MQNIKKLYAAHSLDGGDCYDYTWAASEDEAFDYWFNGAPIMSEMGDNLSVELVPESEYAEIAKEYPELFDELEESCGIKHSKESYRRTVSRGASLVDNELFIDFE